jgi:hypothetical protein
MLAAVAAPMDATFSPPIAADVRTIGGSTNFVVANTFFNLVDIPDNQPGEPMKYNVVRTKFE